MHENTISIVITWFTNLMRFAAVAAEGADSVHLVVEKMLTCGHAVIEIVHVQSMPLRHILWSKQRCYRLFETLRHAVVHVDVPAVLRLGMRQDAGLDSILDRLVFVVHPERQPTSPLYRTFVDGDMLAEVVERSPMFREQVVPRSLQSVFITVRRQIFVIEVEVPLDLKEPTSTHHL